MNWYKVSVRGLMATDSKSRFYEVTVGNRSVLTPEAVWGRSGSKGFEMIEAAGLAVIGSKQCTALVQEIGEIRDFAHTHIAEKIGWNGKCFALPSGCVYAPEGSNEPMPAFIPIRNKCETGGKLKSWKREVAAPMQGQALLQFGLMLMFAAPLLRLSPVHGNFGFEIVGEKETGKSSLQRLMSSVCGGSGQGPEGHYYVDCDTTYAALEDTMDSHSDMALVMDESNLLSGSESAKNKAAMFKAIAFKLSAGSMRNRKAREQRLEQRFIYFLSSNDPLASLIGQDDGSARAAADRLITIPIATDRKYGVLEHLPDGYEYAADFVRDLLHASSKHYGVAIHAYIRALVNACAQDRTEVMEDIELRMRFFRKRMHKQFPETRKRRVIEAFALVFAGGRMAQKFGVLPKTAKFDCFAAAEACYRMHLQRGSAGLTFMERLKRLADEEDIPNLGQGEVPEITDEQYERGLFLRDRGASQLMIRTDRIERYFQDWAKIRSLPEAEAARHKGGGKHKGVARRVGSGREKIRVYSFVLE